MYSISEIRNKILTGNAIDILRQIPSNSIDCFITSPPYYHLRAYGTTPVVWSKNAECEHEFMPAEDRTLKNTNGTGTGTVQAKKGTKTYEKIESSFCGKCGAWRGELGQEPTSELFIDHLIEIFSEVKRVLKDTGTCWVNIGDTYAGSGGAGGDYNTGGLREGQPKFSGANTKEYPAKSLMNIPNRLAEKMIKELGFIMRNEIIWYKKNVMPQSANDRFTVDFEKVFFFTKNQKYFFEKQYEPLSPLTIKELEDKYTGTAKKNYEQSGAQNASDAKRNILKSIKPLLGRNKRAVWQINTKPFYGAHFAVYPVELALNMIKAGCPKLICVKCGEPSKTVYSEVRLDTRPGLNVNTKKSGTDIDPNKSLHNSELSKKRQTIIRYEPTLKTCNCNAGFEKGIVLDCFMGSGTTKIAAIKHGVDYIGIDVEKTFTDMAESRKE